MSPTVAAEDEREVKVTPAMFSKNMLYAAVAIAGMGLILNYLFRWIR